MEGAYHDWDYGGSYLNLLIAKQMVQCFEFRTPPLTQGFSCEIAFRSARSFPFVQSRRQADELHILQLFRQDLCRLGYAGQDLHQITRAQCHVILYSTKHVIGQN